MVRCFFKEGNYIEATKYLKDNQEHFKDKSKYWEQLAHAAKMSGNFDEEI